MKTLYALSCSLILILVLAAFNPDTVVDVYEVAKIRLVEMPRALEQVEQKRIAAEAGDMHAMYDIAWYHLSSSKWHFPEYFPDVLGPKDPDRGIAMMRDAAEAGHPEAIYSVSQHDGHDEAMFVAALEAGSKRALGEAWVKLTKDVCNEDAYRHMMIVRAHAGDPDYPWAGRSPWLSDADRQTVDELRRAWWSDLTSNLSQIDSLRSETCTSAG